MANPPDQHYPTFRPNPPGWRPEPQQPAYNADPQQSGPQRSMPPQPGTDRPTTATAQRSMLSQYWWMLLIAVSLVAIVAALLLRPSTQPEPAEPPAPETTTQIEQIPDQPESTEPDPGDEVSAESDPRNSNAEPRAAIGEMVNIADLEITLLSVNPRLGSLGSEKPEVGEFVTVDLRFTNLNSFAVDVSYNGVVLHLTDDTQHTADYHIFVDGTYSSERIEPSATFEGMLFFDVPVGASFDSLHVSGGKSNDRAINAIYDLSSV